jgi:hypothetical protein
MNKLNKMSKKNEVINEQKIAQHEEDQDRAILKKMRDASIEKFKATFGDNVKIEDAEFLE